MNTLLLLVAILITILMFIPLLVIQSIRRHKTLNKFHMNLAINIDYVWGALIFGANGHTVSALVYKDMIDGNKRYAKYVNKINQIFKDPLHCSNAYKHEFENKRG